MVKIDDLKITDLLTPNLKSDQRTFDTLTAIDQKLNEHIARIRLLNYFKNPNLWTEEITNELAWQFHVDYYDPDLPLEQRRQLVFTSIAIHKRKGTASAVEDLVTTVFGYGKVEEWYEYGDDPGYFQVVLDNPKATNEQALQFLALVDSVKRESAHLRRVLLQETSITNEYYGVSTHTGGTETVKVVNV